MTEDLQANTIGRCYRITCADGSEVVLVEIEIHCDACGEILAVLPGHHLHAIHQLLTEYLAANQDLLGDGKDVQTLSRLRFGSPAPGDVTKN